MPSARVEISIRKADREKFTELIGEAPDEVHYEPDSPDIQMIWNQTSDLNDSDYHFDGIPFYGCCDAGLYGEAVPCLWAGDGVESLEMECNSDGDSISIFISPDHPRGKPYEVDEAVWAFNDLYQKAKALVHGEEIPKALNRGLAIGQPRNNASNVTMFSSAGDVSIERVCEWYRKECGYDFERDSVELTDAIVVNVNLDDWEAENSGSKWRAAVMAIFATKGVDDEAARNEVDAWVESYPDYMENTPEDTVEEMISHWGPD
jgi:hypothetical protein